jgi:hypothetical protein
LEQYPNKAYMKNLKGLLFITLLSVSSFSMASNKTHCATNMNSSNTITPISFDLLDKSMAGTWKTSEESNLGHSWDAYVEVKNGKITTISLGHSDGEGGVNKTVHPNTNFASFKITQNLAIVCNVGGTRETLFKKMLQENMEN